MKQCIRWKDQGQLREEPAGPASPETQRVSSCGPLGKQRDALNDEEDGRPAIPATGRNRDHQIMDKTAEQESNGNSPSGTQTSGQRLEEEAMRDVSERRVPSPAPELAEAVGPKRFVHQRSRLDTRSSPRATQEMKRAEVEHQNQSNHSDPAAKDSIVLRNRPSNDPEQCDSRQKFCTG